MEPNPILGVGTLVALLMLYFAPWLVAWSRGARSVNGVAVLNLFLGWTLLGWVAALVWAVSDRRTSEAEATAPDGASAVADVRRIAANLAERSALMEAGKFDEAVAHARTYLAESAERPVSAREREVNRLREDLDHERTTLRELTDEQEDIVRARAKRVYSCGLAGLLRGEGGAARAKAVAALPLGSVLRFRPEPDNPVDPNAVAIMRGETHLGYVPRRSAWIREALDEGDALAGVLCQVEEARGYAVSARLLVLAPGVRCSVATIGKPPIRRSTCISRTLCEPIIHESLLR
jgi:hypothetical protein